MKIIVTGSEGFIGQHLVKSLLKSNHDVTCWDITLNKDIKDFHFTEHHPDFVIHLAALTNVRESVSFPDEYWKTNVEYSKIIFDACQDIPMVYASSSCASQWWKSPYGTTKRVMEELAYDGHIGLRFTVVWGPGSPPHMLMSRLADGKIKYKTNHIRDFLHVFDAVKAIELIMNIGTKHGLVNHMAIENKVYDVGTGKGVVVSELVERYGIDVPLKEGEPCEMYNNVADITEIEKLGWKPTMDFYR